MTEERRTTTPEFSRPRYTMTNCRQASLLMREEYQRMQQVKEAGGRFSAWCFTGTSAELLKLFDIDALYPENYGTVLGASGAMGPFIEVANSEGYSANCCSYTRGCLGYARLEHDTGEAPKAPRGGMGKSDMMIGPSGCDVRPQWFECYPRYYPDIPVFIWDASTPPAEIDPDDPYIEKHYKSHQVAQLRDFVAFLVKHTGKKFDEAELSKMLDIGLKARRIWFAAYQLRKAVPSPMASQDFFNLMGPQMYMLGRPEVVDFYQQVYDEIKERVDSGTGIMPEERHRLLWVCLPIWFNMGLFNYLMELGIAPVAESMFSPLPPIPEVDFSDPIRAMVDMSWHQSTYMIRQSRRPGGCGHPMGQRIIDFVNEYKVDGIIMNLPRTCRTTSIGQKHALNMAKQKIDVPSVEIITDMTDPSLYDDGYVKQNIHALLETMEARKKAR